jgi:hypothetical protein
VRSTEQHISKLVAERHSDVRMKLEGLLNAIATTDLVAVQIANNQLEDSLVALGAVVAREHWPNWLVQLLQNTTNYRTNHNNGIGTWIAHLRSLIANAPLVESHTWFQTEYYDPVFDVDQLINAARAEFKIDELFERIIETLKGLSASEELDSAKAIRDLEEVIAILRRAKSGSFTAQYRSWQFARRFVPNLISAYLKRSDLAGPAIEAFEQTAQELDLNLGNAKDQISEELLEAARAGFKSDAVKEITTDHILSLPDDSPSTNRD